MIECDGRLPDRPRNAVEEVAKSSGPWCKAIPRAVCGANRRMRLEANCSQLGLEPSSVIDGLAMGHLALSKNIRYRLLRRDDDRSRCDHRAGAAHSLGSARKIGWRDRERSSRKYARPLANR